MKNLISKPLATLALTAALIAPIKAQESTFKITISGGALDGKNLTGKVGLLPSRIGIASNKGSTSLAFNEVKLEGSPARAHFSISWKGDADDGKKPPHFDNDGTPKYGNCGSLTITDPSPGAAFSKFDTKFKDLDLVLKDATPWVVNSSRTYERKTFSGTGGVKKSVTQIYKENSRKADSKNEDVTLTFSFTAKASRIKMP